MIDHREQIILVDAIRPQATYNRSDQNFPEIRMKIMYTHCTGFSLSWALIPKVVKGSMFIDAGMRTWVSIFRGVALPF